MNNEELLKHLYYNYKKLIEVQSSIGNPVVAKELDTYTQQAREAWETAALMVKTMALWEKTRCPHTIMCDIHNNGLHCTCNAKTEKKAWGLCRNINHSYLVHAKAIDCTAWTEFDPESILPKEY